MQGGILGLTLGVVTFSVSYFVEYLILKNMGLHPQFSFYIANFTISNQNIIGVSMSALAICLLGNIVNVWAEEGLFRRLLFQIGKMSYTQKTANLIQSILSCNVQLAIFVVSIQCCASGIRWDGRLKVYRLESDLLDYCKYIGNEKIKKKWRLCKCLKKEKYYMVLY